MIPSLASAVVAWELARKDLQLFLADRRGAILCFAIPILLASVFGTLFHRPDGEDHPRPDVLVVAEDTGPFTAAVVEGLERSARLQARRADLAQAMRRLADDRPVVVVLPTGFAGAARLARASGEELPAVRILHHPAQQVESRWVEGILTEVVLREAARSLLGPLVGTPGANSGGEPDRPFSVDRQTVPAGGALSVHAYSHSFCGMTLQYLLFWGMDSGLLLLRERRQGIWRRLRAAPVTRGTLLTGKALGTAVIALAQVAVTFGFGAVVFGVRINGSPIGFLILALALAVLASATGLLVAAVGGNEGRARSVAILVILVLSLLGGLWFPSFLLPGWTQRLALALPTTWAARGLEGVVWQGMGTSEAVGCAAVVVGFALVFLLVAWWGLVRSEVRARLEGGR
jgi:ABC-2 type transport system permease protein